MIFKGQPPGPLPLKARAQPQGKPTPPQYPTSALPRPPGGGHTGVALRRPLPLPYLQPRLLPQQPRWEQDPSRAPSFLLKKLSQAVHSSLRFGPGSSSVTQAPDPPGCAQGLLCPTAHSPAGPLWSPLLRSRAVGTMPTPPTPAPHINGHPHLICRINSPSELRWGQWAVASLPSPPPGKGRRYQPDKGWAVPGRAPGWCGQGPAV